MSLIAEGTVVSGLGLAASMMEYQLPKFIIDRLELAVCKPGTINVKLDKPLRVATPDFSLGPLVYQGGVSESYGFVAIGLELPIGSQPQPAWIYLPDKSPHMNNLHHVELIGPPLGGVTTGARCRIHIERSFETVTVTVVV